MAELLYNVFKNTKNEKKNLTILASDLTWAYKKEHNLMNWSHGRTFVFTSMRESQNEGNFQRNREEEGGVEQRGLSGDGGGNSGLKWGREGGSKSWTKLKFAKQGILKIIV